jgi:hypothetical protein
LMDVINVLNIQKGLFTQGTSVPAHQPHISPPLASSWSPCFGGDSNSSSRFSKSLKMSLECTLNSLVGSKESWSVDRLVYKIYSCMPPCRFCYVRRSPRSQRRLICLAILWRKERPLMSKVWGFFTRFFYVELRSHI